MSIVRIAQPGDEVYAGRVGPRSAVQDWYFDPNDFAQKFRKVIICDVGDPPDLAIRRIGPDGAPWDESNFQAVADGHNIGTVYWQAWNSADGFDGRNAQIYTRAQGQQTKTSSGGSLHLASTPVGSTNPVDRIVINDDGVLDLSGLIIQNGRIKVRVNGQIKYLQLVD